MFKLQTKLTQTPGVSVSVHGGTDAMVADCIAAHAMLPVYLAAQDVAKWGVTGEGEFGKALAKLHDAINNPTMA